MDVQVHHRTAVRVCRSYPARLPERGGPGDLEEVSPAFKRPRPGTLRSDVGQERLAAGAAPKAAVLTIGVSPVPHADIVNFVAPTLKNQGIEVKVVEFSDYVQPNLSLADKELDANFFQHKPYLDEFAESRGLKLESLVAVHIEPMGVYSKSVKKVEDLAEGAKIAIPNDPTNGGRALKVLETAGLIKLKADAGILATPNDIVENPKKLSFLEIEAAQLPRALDDVAAAVINSNFALEIGRAHV